MFDLYGMCEEIAITDTHGYSSSLAQNIHLSENISSKVIWIHTWLDRYLDNEIYIELNTFISRK